MKKFSISVIVLWLFLATNSCTPLPKHCDGGIKQVEFDMPIRLSPIKDTLKLGDTLWVELRLDNPLLNKKDGNKYDISDAKWYMFFDISDLLTNTVVPTPNFIRLNENGNYDAFNNPDGDRTSGIVFKRDGNQHYWKKGFIITKRGRYLLSFVNYLNYRSSKPNITKCPKEEFTLNFYFNGSLNADSKNFKFLQNIPDDNVGSWSRELFERNPCYAICVN